MEDVKAAEEREEKEGREGQPTVKVQRRQFLSTSCVSQRLETRIRHALLQPCNPNCTHPQCRIGKKRRREEKATVKNQRFETLSTPSPSQCLETRVRHALLHICTLFFLLRMNSRGGTTSESEEAARRIGTATSGSPHTPPPPPELARFGPKCNS